MKQYDDIFNTWNDELYTFLVDNGCEPILIDNGRYFFETTEELLKYIDCYYMTLDII